MRRIERPSSFRRDFKRESKGRHRSTLGEVLQPVLEALVADLALEAHYLDHSLSGEWSGYRECHLKPDLLLIYRKKDDDLLILARLGSHSELFG